MNTRENQIEAFERLLDIMDELREKCPWDRKQTIESLRTLTIEEVYELSDAIVEKNTDEIKKELGDIFLHLVFYSKIASEQNQFDTTDVLNSICEKLIRRHPHIYSDVEIKTEEEVVKNWEQIKLKEGNSSVLSGVPTSLPAIIKAYRIQEKVKGAGFKFKTPELLSKKLQEDIKELKNETEFGEILFSLINYGQSLGINSEDALEKTNKKFIDKFKKLEIKLNESNTKLNDLTASEQNKLW